MIDLRSDTVTKPGQKMRDKIRNAEVGDDVYGEDPSVNKLEAVAAELFNKESGLFVPSGTMGNQVAINVHTQPGNEVILDKDSHILNYEMGAISSISGAMPHPIYTQKKYLPINRVKELIKPDKYYLSETGLIALENTQNIKGGVTYPLKKAKKLKDIVGEKNIPIHLDGARIFNASIAREKEVSELTSFTDSVMFCLSKGLGAPVGSVLVGSDNFIQKAREIRKKLGGGMRQAGILAQAGVFALKNNVEKLEKDHKKAKKLYRLLNESEKIDVRRPETNIVVFDIPEVDKERFLRKLKQKNVLLDLIGPEEHFRAVTHLDITKTGIRESASKIKGLI